MMRKLNVRNACGRRRCTALILALLLAVQAGGAWAAAVVDWSIEHQTMDGFGASNAFLDTALTDTQADMFFSQSNGIGLSWLRMGLNSSGNLNGGAWSDATKAAARGAKVWAAPWTAPAAWKDNGSETNGGHLCAAPGQGTCDASHYDDWATRLAAFPALLKLNAGVDLYGLSIQNEPDFVASYESMLVSNSEFVNFINVLGPKLAALNPKPKIIAGEHSDWQYLDGMKAAIGANTSALANTAIFAIHQYVPQHVVAETAPRPIWETEMSSFEAFDAGLANAVTVGKWIHSAIAVGNVNAWHYWWLFNPYNADNEGLIGHPGDAFAITKRYYALGNYSKFVRPGWKRIDTSGVASANLFATAYKAADGNFAIVVVNDSGGDLAFAANLAHMHVTSVTPWITSATLNLAAQAPVAVAGNQISVVVPYGVTTLVGVNDEIFGNGFD
jgi:glucuronoarabinoxylan endo-1,4-beta-xylanase